MHRPRAITANRLKNAALTVLVALCLAQTSNLWFGGLPGARWFTGMFAKGSAADEAESLARLVTPFRVIVNVGENPWDNRLSIRYNDLGGLAAKAAADAAIEQTLRKGDFAGAAVKTDLTAAPCLAYEYAVTMSSEAFVGVYRQRMSILTGRVKLFDDVVVLPDASGVTVSFESRAGATAWQYRLNDAAAARGVLAAIVEARADAGKLLYRYDDTGAAPLYTAFWDGAAFPYATVSAANPYGDLTYANIARFMEPFFDKSAQRGAPKNADGVYTFSNDRTTVYYYPSGVLECYFSYQRFSDNVVSSLPGSYAAALAAIEKDATLTNEFYLATAEKTQNGYFFGFDCAEGDYPLVLSKDLRQTTGLSHMIEITVEKDSLKYRRYVASFQAGTGASEAARGYEAVAATFGLSPDYPVEALRFGYRVDGSDTLNLCWFVEVDGTEFALTAD